MIRSDSEGDADTILEAVGEDYFPPDFKEYLLQEQLKWSRHKWSWYSGWVFWSQQDHEIEPSHSLDNCADFNPNVCPIPKLRDNIRLALHKLISSERLFKCLVQFWAATTTLEGRTKLTTQYQPFALGLTYDPWTDIRQQLCEYRMKMCRDYNFFYADAESGKEQQLGLLGRVFLHKSPESSPDVYYYSTKEYPQRDLALRCKIKESWAVPVFEHSSQTCVGVLEMVSLYKMSEYWPDKSFFRCIDDAFQELGLQYFDGFHACVDEGKSVEGLPRAFKELKTVLTLVCKIHELPLAMTWVLCSACNGLRQCEVFSQRLFRLNDFLKAAKRSHLRKGLVAERARSSPNMLYCSDITQLSLDEYPLVPYARLCKLSGWFIICLQNIYTGNDIYVLEFFLSARSKDDEKILTTLSFILGTIEEKSTTFRLASGKELGEEMSVEVIYFKNDQKFQFDRSIQATRDFSSRSSDMSSLQSSASVNNTIPVTITNTRLVTIKVKYDLNSDPLRKFSSISIDDTSSEQSSASVTNKGPGFQDANMVAIKATYDLNSDLPRNFSSRSSYMSSVQSSPSVASTRLGFQDANMVTIEAKYGLNSDSDMVSYSDMSFDSDPSFEQSTTGVANTIERVLQVSLPCRLVELHQEVAKSMKLEAETFHVVYKDEVDGFVLIACDEDLQAYVDDSISQGNTSHVVLLTPKEPAIN